MSISREEILKLAHLARLELQEGEIEKIKGSLEEMVDYMDQLKQLDLKEVEPMMRVEADEKAWREDQVRPGLSREQAFKNAPSIKLDHFAIPKTVK